MMAVKRMQHFCKQSTSMVGLPCVGITFLAHAVMYISTQRRYTFNPFTGEQQNLQGAVPKEAILVHFINFVLDENRSKSELLAG